jgi:hypothetical protein
VGGFPEGWILINLGINGTAPARIERGLFGWCGQNATAPVKKGFPVRWDLFYAVKSPYKFALGALGWNSVLAKFTAN